MSQPLFYTLGSEYIPFIPYQVSYIELCVQWKSDDDKSVPPTFTGQQTNDYVAPSECKKHTASFEQFSYTNMRGMTEGKGKQSSWLEHFSLFVIYLQTVLDLCLPIFTYF